MPIRPILCHFVSHVKFDRTTGGWSRSSGWSTASVVPGMIWWCWCLLTMLIYHFIIFIIYLIIFYLYYLICFFLLLPFFAPFSLVELLLHNNLWSQDGQFGIAKLAWTWWVATKPTTSDSIAPRHLQAQCPCNTAETMAEIVCRVSCEKLP